MIESFSFYVIKQVLTSDKFIYFDKILQVPFFIRMSCLYYCNNNYSLIECLKNKTTIPISLFLWYDILSSLISNTIINLLWYLLGVNVLYKILLIYKLNAL